MVSELKPKVWGDKVEGGGEKKTLASWASYHEEGKRDFAVATPT